jgi:membrane-associated phospholipid phosphatase
MLLQSQACASVLGFVFSLNKLQHDCNLFPTFALLMMEYLIGLDQSLFRLINGQWHNAFLDWLLPFWREKTTWLPLYGALVGYVFYSMQRKAAMFLLLAAVLSVGLADTLSSKVVKPEVARLRPCRTPALQGEVRSLVPCGGGFSFTSSHAANHFALAVFLVFALARRPWARGLLLAWAASISYGQVYVGVHFPLDVLFGAFMGSAVGYVCFLLYQSSLRRFGPRTT